MCDVPSIAVFCGEFIEFSLIIIIIIIIIIITTTIFILTSVHLLGVRRGLMLHLITHAHSIALLWTTDRPTWARLPDRTNHTVKSYVYFD